MEASVRPNTPDMYNLPPSVTPQPAVYPTNKHLDRVICYEFGSPTPLKKAKMKEEEERQQPLKHPGLQPKLLPKPDNTDSRSVHLKRPQLAKI
ncbi:hypothetical protein FPOAC2_09260 [Fusarium poae]